jgi:PHD/YefM family antitoxin component YafN of YafNO toxin-antitoxin module
VDIPPRSPEQDQLQRVSDGVLRAVDWIRETLLAALLRTSGEPSVVISQREYESLRLTADVLEDDEALNDLSISEQQYSAGDVSAWAEYRRELGLGSK